MSIDKHTPDDLIPSNGFKTIFEESRWLMTEKLFPSQDYGENEDCAIIYRTLEIAETVAFENVSLKEENEKLKVIIEEERRIKKANESAINVMLGKSIAENKRLREALESILTLNEETRTSSPFKLTKFKDKVSDLASAALSPIEDEKDK